MLATALARHARLPSIVLLFGAGIALGPDALGWLEPRGLGEGLFAVVDLGVAIILFEGGLSLDLGRLRREARPIRLLVTLGVGITGIGAALAAHSFMGWPWSQSALFGSLVVVTGPTVIRPLLRRISIRRRLATILEAEGLLNDAIGAIAVVVVLQVVLAGEAPWATSLRELGLRLAFGAGAGFAFGAALARLLSWGNLAPQGLENVLTLGTVLAFFEGCEALLPESGLLAATVAGAVVGSGSSTVVRELREFKEQLSTAAIGVLFVLLAADVRLAEVTDLGMSGVLVVGSLALVVRPICVAACTIGTDLDWRERAVLAWIAPRGVVAAAVASLAAVRLEAHGLSGGNEMRALAFLTIAVTVVVQGVTAGPLARLLRVQGPRRDLTVIYGAGALGLALARALRDGGSRVTLIDDDPHAIQTIEAEEGLAVIYGNPLDERTWRRAQLDQARAAVATTASDSANVLFTTQVSETFGVKECYVATDRLVGPTTPSFVARLGNRVLFDGARSIARWERRIERDEVTVERFAYDPDSEATVYEPTGELAAPPFLILAVGGEDGTWEPMYAGRHNRIGDRAAALVSTADRHDAVARLAARGWLPEE